MKNSILFFLITVCSFTAKAQGTSISIYNNSTCTVFFTLRGGSTCIPSASTRSALLSLPPSGSMSFTSAATPILGWTLTSSAYFLALETYNADPNSPCSAANPPTPVVISETCYGTIQTFGYLSILSSLPCAQCRPTSVVATWTNAVPGLSGAVVTFN